MRYLPWLREAEKTKQEMQKKERKKEDMTSISGSCHGCEKLRGQNKKQERHERESLEEGEGAMQKQFIHFLHSSCK